LPGYKFFDLLLVTDKSPTQKKLHAPSQRLLGYVMWLLLSATTNNRVTIVKHDAYTVQTDDWHDMYCAGHCHWATSAERV